MCSNIFFFLRWSLALSPRLELELQWCNLCLLGSRDSPASTSWVAEILMCHHVCLISLHFYYRRGFTLLERLVSNSWPCDVTTLGSQSAGITGMSHCARPYDVILASHCSKLCMPSMWLCQLLSYFKQKSSSPTISTTCEPEDQKGLASSLKKIKFLGQ